MLNAGILNVPGNAILYGRTRRTRRAGCVHNGVHALHIQSCDVRIDMGARVPRPLHASSSWQGLKWSLREHAFLSTCLPAVCASSRNHCTLPALPGRFPENGVCVCVRVCVTMCSIRPVILN